MMHEALVLEILNHLMAENTINPPGNERRGAARSASRRFSTGRASPVRFRSLGITGRILSRRSGRVIRFWS